MGRNRAYQVQLAQAEGGYQAAKTITFDGGTTNAIGDHDGTGDPFDIFNVTGSVAMKLYGRCTTDLVGASATLEVGTALTTAGLIAQTTAANIDANEIWHDNSPDASVELTSVMAERMISDDVIGTVGTANITAGVIEFVCIWKPLSPNASVEAA